MVNLTNRLPTAPPIARRRTRDDAPSRARMMASKLPTPPPIARRRAADDTAARNRVIGISIGALLSAFAIGALADRYIFDRQNGRRRRHMARERSIAKVRRRARDTARRARYLEGVAEGMAHKAAHAVPGTNSQKEPPDDLTLAQKVESEAFRHAAVSKAHVSVNAESGTVYLRGRLDSDEEIQKLVKATEAVDGVKRVESLLHTA
jgi:hypothetical protein